MLEVSLMIERTEYLEELKRWKDKDLIKVITGIRRCGKSTLFELYINYLKENGVNESQIIKINLEDIDYHFESYRELYNYINEKIDTKKNIMYLLTKFKMYLNFKRRLIVYT